MDLARLLAGGPLAGHRALTLIHPLALATRELHRWGRTAGLDDPRRVQVVDGELVLEPPAERYPEAGSSLEDVRGLGALLYTLLTGYWPLAGAVHGLPPAPRRPDGIVRSPSELRPDVALEVSELAMAALGADQGRSAARICTAGAMVRLVEELLRNGWTVDLLPPDDGNDPSWSYEPVLDRTATDAGTRRKLSLGVSGLVAAALVTVGAVGVETASAFGLLPTNGPPPIVVGNSTPTGFEAGPAAPASAGPVSVLGGAGTFGPVGALDRFRDALAAATTPPTPAATRATPQRRPAAAQRPARDRDQSRQQRERDSDDRDRGSNEDEGEDD
jgi:hypothetical protein